jgi:oligopeptide transport system substrate-binding protein
LDTRRSAASGSILGTGRWLTLLAALAAAVPATGCRARGAPTGGEQVVRMALDENPPQLDATKATDTVSSFILGHIQEGLTEIGPHGEIVPGVAESWEIRDLSATFHLRKEAIWSDGKPVTAKDFVFAWRNVVDPANASEYAFIMFPVKNGEAINAGKLPLTALGVHAVDDRTLEVELERPCPYFLGLSAFKTYDPIREDFYRARPGRYGASPEDLLSNGPFVLTRWDQDSSITLTKNPRYWNAKSIKLARIEIPYITRDANARLNLFRDGNIDFLDQVGRDEAKRAEAERLPLKSFPEGATWFMEFNHREGRPTSNLHLRRAIALIFDQREYISAVLGIAGTRPGIGAVPSWIPGVKDTYRKEHPLTPFQPNLEEAKKELDLARQELGRPITKLTYLTFEGGGAKRDAEYFQYLFRKTLGIELVIDKQIFKQVLAKRTAGDFDIAGAGWVADYGDGMTYADLWTSWNENNRSGYKSARYDARIRAALATADPAARLQDMADAERIAMEDVAFLPLYETCKVYLQSRRVAGIVRHQIGPDPDLNQAYVVEEEPKPAWSATR